MVCVKSSVIWSLRNVVVSSDCTGFDGGRGL